MDRSLFQSITKTKVFLFAVFAIVSGTLVYFHEPWRDEADTWLMATNLSIKELLSISGNMGHPILWHLYQMVFAKLGFSFETQGWIHWLVALYSGALLVFFSPFKLWLKIPVLFGFYFSFQYSAVARNYALGIACLLTAASLFKNRFRYPWLYGLVLLLMANTTAHFMFFAAVLTCEGLFCFYRNPESRKTILPIVLIGGLGTLVSIIQLWPGAQGQMPQLIVSNLNMSHLPKLLSRPFWPFNDGVLQVATGSLIIGLVFAALRRSRTELLVTLGIMLSLVYVIVFKYAFGNWHYGLMLVSVLFGLWIGLSQTYRATIYKADAFSAAQFVLATFLWIQIPQTISLWHTEITLPFSASKEMANMIKDNGLEDYPMVGHFAPHASALLPYLKGKKFWYPGMRRYGTHMNWDQSYIDSLKKSGFDAIREATYLSKFSEDKPFLVVASKPIPQARGLGYVPLLKSSKPWFFEGESYILYVPFRMAQNHKNTGPKHATHPF